MIDGGEKMNAIPRFTNGRFIIPKLKSKEFIDALNHVGDILKEEWKGKENDLEI
jgi:hypothetical protein